MHALQAHAGETWGKRHSNGNVVVYLVLNVDRKGRLTLQNLKTPSSVFETDADKLERCGYFLMSETPYVNLAAAKRRRAKSRTRLTRCPRTVDMFEGRADSEFPAIPA